MGSISGNFFEAFFFDVSSHPARPSAASSANLSIPMASRPHWSTKITRYALPILRERAAAASLVREARGGHHKALVNRILKALARDDADLIKKAVVWLKRERARADG
jgi:hypothetical protein